jgi:hypothetical protein
MGGTEKAKTQRARNNYKGQKVLDLLLSLSIIGFIFSNLFLLEAISK